jgi:uncharacterized protein (DUF1697 family)
MTYISILRGVNVGGHNQIKMEPLRQMYAGLGYTLVQSYIQSGNVIFNAYDTDTITLEESISATIFLTFGIRIAAIVLTTDELGNALKDNPYYADLSKDSARIYFTFLSKVPDIRLLETVPPSFYAPDEFSCVDKVIYNYCPNGYGNTKLTNTFFEKRLKLNATSRNLKTVTELFTLAQKVQMPS